AGREGAVGGGRGPAPGQELVQDACRADVRAQAREAGAPGSVGGAVVRPGRGVPVAVEDHRADLAGEQVGVGGAQVRAVGVAPVGELLVADRAPEQVQVPGGVGGRYVAQEFGVAFLAVAGQLFVGGGPGRALLRPDREAGRLGLLPGGCLLGAAEAVHGGAVADPAGVPADDVETLPDLVGERLVVLRHLHGAGPAGSAGVEEEGAGAPAGVGRLAFDDGEFDG